MTTSSSSMRVIALALLWNQVQCAAVEYKPIHGFEINPETADIMELARDMDAIQQLLDEVKGAHKLRQCWDIYTLGGYSSSTANVTLGEPLPFLVPQELKVTALAMNGDWVEGYPLESTLSDSPVMSVRYTQSDAPCHVGGLPENMREDGGCFASPGYFRLGNEDKLIPFTYDTVSGNANTRSIRELSYYANRYYRQHADPDGEFHKFFNKHIDYYGENQASFLHQVSQAIYDGNKYYFDKGFYDFTLTDDVRKCDFFETISAYAITGMSFIKELEEAVLYCQDDCTNCVHESVKSVDQAAAYYTGVMQQEDGSGNLLYGLADNMCTKFRTCGENGSQGSGTAKVNLDIFESLEKLKTQVGKKNCDDAEETKNRITNLMFVPIVQGFQFSVFKLNNPSLFTNEPDGSLAFGAMLFPLLDKCGMEQAGKMRLDFKAGGEFHIMRMLDGVRDSIQDHYECLDICCHQIGGVWDPENSEYFRDQNPCVDSSEMCLGGATAQEADSEGGSFGTWMLVILIVAVLLTMCLYYRQRSRYYPSTGDSSSGSMDLPSMS